MTVKTYPMKILAALLFSLALPVTAATLEGRVVGVSDWDTITILDQQKVQHRIRLSAIDAPEKAQPFGNRSKEHLSKWVYNRSVLVEWNKRDRYGRIVGQVLVDGHDVGLEQIRAGMAWWYREYSKEQSPEDRELYDLTEQAAKDLKVGFWRDVNPMPPWEWRRKEREKK